MGDVGNAAEAAWRPIDELVYDPNVGMFETVVASFSTWEDGSQHLIWAHVAYLTRGGDWMTNSAGLHLHGNASFHVGNPTHFMRLKQAPSGAPPHPKD